MYIQRTIENAVKRMNSSFPVVLITGLRQVSKTTVFMYQRMYCQLIKNQSRNYGFIA